MGGAQGLKPTALVQAERLPVGREVRVSQFRAIAFSKLFKGR